MTFPKIRYLDWAKRRFDVDPPAFNLGSSGMEAATVADLGLDVAGPLPISGAAAFGHAGLRRAIGDFLGIAPDRVFPALGTTHANFVTQAALLSRGDEVLCELPAYEPLWRSLETLGARVHWLPREPETAFVPDLSAIAQAFAQGTRLAVLSDLHNPSCALLPREFVRELARLAARYDAWAMVDEVYLSGADAGPVESAARFGDRIVATGSLTKTFGLGPLRAGWVAGPPALIERLFELQDHLGAGRPYLAEEAAVRAFERLEHLAARMRRRRAENWPLVKAACAGVPGLVLHESAGGFIAWARLPGGMDADAFVERLSDTHGTLVVPGGFFGRPDHVRLGFGAPREHVAEALARFVRSFSNPG